MLAPTIAHSATHSVCLHFDLDQVYRDASPAGDNCSVCFPNQAPFCCEQGEQFGRRDGDDRWAVPRLLVRVRDDAEVLWGWRPLDEFGCTSLIQTDATVVDVDYLPWSYWSDRDTSVVGMNCDSVEAPQRCAFEDGSVEDIALDISGTTRVMIVDPDGGGDLLATNSILWGASFAEERMPLWTGIVTYLVSSNNGFTEANLRIGGQPTAYYTHGSARQKFTIAHEYGHTQTVYHPLAIFGEMFGAEDVDYSFMDPNPPGHSLTSPEWQAAAALEGFAEYYSLLVWWDASSPVAKLLGASNFPNELLWLTDTDPVRYVDTVCQPLGLTECPPGVAVESDWMAALWQFSLSGTSPDEVLKLLSLAYMWPVNGESDAYWINFVDKIGNALSQSQIDTFLTIAEQSGINR